METVIFIGGVFNLLFALFHIGFWRFFHWKDELSKLRFENRGIVQILNIQMTYYFIFTALICFLFPHELLGTTLGKGFLAGSSGFWLIRTINQLVLLRANHWVLHILTIFFILGTIIFAFPLLSRL